MKHTRVGEVMAAEVVPVDRATPLREIATLLSHRSAEHPPSPDSEVLRAT